VHEDIEVELRVWVIEVKLCTDEGEDGVEVSQIKLASL
jgi:hypothetical protein